MAWTIQGGTTMSEAKKREVKIAAGGGFHVAGYGEELERIHDEEKAHQFAALPLLIASAAREAVESCICDDVEPKPCGRCLARAALAACKPQEGK